MHPLSVFKNFNIPIDYTDFADLTNQQQNALIQHFCITYPGRMTVNWKCCGTQSRFHIDRSTIHKASQCHYIKNHGRPIYNPMQTDLIKPQFIPPTNVIIQPTLEISPVSIDTMPPLEDHSPIMKRSSLKRLRTDYIVLDEEPSKDTREKASPQQQEWIQSKTNEWKQQRDQVEFLLQERINTLKEKEQILQAQEDYARQKCTDIHNQIQSTLKRIRY